MTYEKIFEKIVIEYKITKKIIKIISFFIYVCNENLKYIFVDLCQLYIYLLKISKN